VLTETGFILQPKGDEIYLKSLLRTGCNKGRSSGIVSGTIFRWREKRNSNNIDLKLDQAFAKKIIQDKHSKTNIQFLFCGILWKANPDLSTNVIITTIYLQNIVGMII